MLKSRIKRRADRGTRALKRVASIERDITGRPDEDLLDLVDILMGRAGSFVGELAAAEMNRRGLAFNGIAVAGCRSHCQGCKDPDTDVQRPFSAFQLPTFV